MRQPGFTLLELIVVLAIMAIVATLAAPSYQQFMASSAVNSATNALVGSLAMARAGAVTRRVAAGVCRTTDANAVTPACSTALITGFQQRDWSSGWIVYAKDNGNANTQAFEAGDAILHRQPALGTAVGSRVVVLADNGAGVYVYGSDGLSANVPLVRTTFTVDYADNPAGYDGTVPGPRARWVDVSLGTGRVTVGDVDPTP